MNNGERGMTQVISISDVFLRNLRTQPPSIPTEHSLTSRDDMQLSSTLLSFFHEKIRKNKRKRKKKEKKKKRRKRLG